MPGSQTGVVMKVRNANTVYCTAEPTRTPAWLLNGPRRSTIIWTARMLQSDFSPLREIRRLEDEVELLRSENRALGEQETPEETRAGIVRWMRNTAAGYAQDSDIVGAGLGNVWSIIANLIAEERDRQITLPEAVVAVERCTETWTQAGWPSRTNP